MLKHSDVLYDLSGNPQNIAESLNISEKKVHNATEVKELKSYLVEFLLVNAFWHFCHSQKHSHMQAVNKVLSLDQQAFPSLNGLPGDTLHSVSRVICSIVFFLTWGMLETNFIPLFLMFSVYRGSERRKWSMAWIWGKVSQGMHSNVLPKRILMHTKFLWQRYAH